MSGVRSGKQTLYSKLIHINSNDRVPGFGGNRSSNFGINLGVNLQECVGISYKSCQFNNNFYNVREATSYNPTFNNRFTATAGTQTFTIFKQPAGFYNAGALMSSMISEIQAYVLSQFGDTWVFSYSVNDASQLITLNFVSAAGPDSVLNVDDTKLAAAGQANSGVSFGPWELLGFPATFSLTSGQSITASNMPSLGGYGIVYIRSQALSPANSFLATGVVSNNFQPINLTAPFQGINTDECKVDVLCEVNYPRPRILNVIDIQLVDHDGFEVNLNGSQLNIEVRAWFNVF